jgi:hypothetical protein
MDHQNETMMEQSGVYNQLEWIDTEKNLMIKHPFTMMVAGSTSSGKSTFVRNLINSLPDILTPEPKFPIRVTWAYGIWQESYRQAVRNAYVHITFVKGLPDVIDADVIVIDDLMTSLADDKSLADLFTKGSHHRNISVIFIVQNIFHSGKQMRNITLNCQYLVLTKSRRDLNQVKVLARQLYSNIGHFMDAYRMAVLDKDYGYLLIDLSPTTQERYRLRSNVTPFEYPIAIYVNKDEIL